MLVINLHVDSRERHLQLSILPLILILSLKTQQKWQIGRLRCQGLCPRPLTAMSMITPTKLAFHYFRDHANIITRDFYNERPIQKVMRKLKEEPLVPLGKSTTTPPTFSTPIGA